MRTTRTTLVYGLLAIGWLVVVAWQAVEHLRFKEAMRSMMIYRARDITTTLGLVVRSQRRFGGIVSQSRLESALNELIKMEPLRAVALLNAAGDTVMAAGEAVGFGTQGMPPTGERWDAGAVTVVNLVDLGADVEPETGTSRPTIVVSGLEPDRRPGEGRPPFARPPSPPPGGEGETNRAEGPGSDEGRREPRRSRFQRPFWMNEATFKELSEKQGVHGLVVVLSTDWYRLSVTRDRWMRGIIVCFAGVSMFGLGLARRNLIQSTELQMRLLRASQMNTHLREMNIAAAGLAHETRNPLNIIRGLAQMIGRQMPAATEIQGQSVQIAEEVDRVTAQLNEFINYSKPREVRRSAVELRVVVNDVLRALRSDLEDKEVRVQTSDERLTVAADEPLLRQVLFNLVVNALHAVDRGGRLEITWERTGADEAGFVVRDDGPGVPPDQRDKIFRPYFTTHQQGTGLGLAVVQQIVLAHGWDVEYIPGDGRGAAFRVSHLKLTS